MRRFQYSLVSLVCILSSLLFMPVSAWVESDKGRTHDADQLIDSARVIDDSGSAMTSDPIAYVGHGVMFDDNGVQIMADRAFANKTMIGWLARSAATPERSIRAHSVTLYAAYQGLPTTQSNTSQDAEDARFPALEQSLRDAGMIIESVSSLSANYVVGI